MDSITFNKFKTDVSAMLEKYCSNLYFHNKSHTLDVLEQAERIAGEMGIIDEEVLMQIKLTALYHDTGYRYGRVNHELESCRIFRQQSSMFNLSENQIENICSLIMATSLFHNPCNIYEEIINDADFDYLGRDDFFEKSALLKKEFLETGVVNSVKEWELLQINFLEKHVYYTPSSRNIREIPKIKHLQILKEQYSATHV